VTGERARQAGTLIGAVAVTALAAGVMAGGGGVAQAGTRHGTQPAVAGVISTEAGGPGGPAAGTAVAVTPRSVVYNGGNLYIADRLGNAVREVNTGTGALTTPDGTGDVGPLGLGGPATQASLSPSSVTLDASGNQVITAGNRVLVTAASTGTFYGQAMTAGDVYNVAGTGAQGYGGNGGAATSATLDYPYGVAVDAHGNLVIADTGNSQIRVVAARNGRFYGIGMTAGKIYHVAGNAKAGYLGDGGPASTAELNQPESVAVDHSGNLVIADTQNDRIRVVAETTGTFYGIAMTAGDIYPVAGNGSPGHSGDGGPATGAEVSVPEGVTVDGSGNLVIADAGNNVVRVVAEATGTFYGIAMTAGDIYTVAGGGTTLGDGGPATSAELNVPGGVTADGSGNLVIADTNDYRVRVVAETTGTFYGIAMTAGDIYTIAGTGQYRLSGASGPATSAEFNAPAGVAIDNLGDTMVADTAGNRVLAAPAAGAKRFYGRAVVAGNIYDEAGNGTAGYSGDGGPGPSAELNGPDSVTADAAGNLVVADTGNNRIRVVAKITGTYYGQAMTGGDIYTVAGNGSQGYTGNGGAATSAALSEPQDAAVDGSGNLVIADTGNNRIRVVAETTGTFYGIAMTAGDIYPVAGGGTALGDGGPASSAQLEAPASVTVDQSGNLVIADTYDYRVRVVAETTGTFYGITMTAGDIYTVAGTGTPGYSGDGGPATSAEFQSLGAVAVGSSGNLVIADTYNNRVRVVAETTGTFYGITMTAGDIYTVAGTGTAGYSGDGGPATSAQLALPGGVAADASGDLLTADTGNNRIRQVAGS